MKRFFILLLLTVLLVATTFGWDLSLAPGLSVKNGFLYLIMGLYLTEAAVLRNQRASLQVEAIRPIWRRNAGVAGISAALRGFFTSSTGKLHPRSTVLGVR